MKKLDNNTKGLLIAGLVALIICIIISYFSWQRTQDARVINDVKNELNVTTTELNAVQEELILTKDNLKIEVEKNDGLSKELGNLRQELEIAHTTIADLKVDEYEFVYMGEFKLTAYCPCEICCGYWATIREKDENGNPIVGTASGALAQANWTIAVDPVILPYGTQVYIAGRGWFEAQDCGGAVNGKHIDVYYDDHNEAAAQGVQYKDIWMLVKKS